MKIIFCDNSLRELWHFREDVILHFLEQDNKIVLAAPRNAVLPGEERFKIVNVPIDRGGMNPLSDIMLFLRLLRIYLMERPDHVFHYTIKPNIYGSIASWLLNIPSTAMVSGLGYSFNHDDMRSRMARKLYKFALKFSSNVLVLNEGNLRVLIEKRLVPESKIIFLPGGEGINLEKYK